MQQPDTQSATISTTSNQKRVAKNDLVLLLTHDNKRFVIRAKAGRILHSHRGKYHHDDIIGQPYGSTVMSQIGQSALLLQPSLSDLIQSLKRGTQIIYPKDAAYLVYRLNLQAGSQVIEAGTGSGALTLVLAWAVAPTGRVHTYERRQSVHNIAKENLKRCNMLTYVDAVCASIEDGFQQEDVDALVLDVLDPWNYLEHVHAALTPGGHFAALMPTTNQVTNLLKALEDAPFTCVDVEELLLRRYKAVPDRLRPEDEMVGHTGYLIFARTIADDVDQSRWLSRERKRYRARQKAEEQAAQKANDANSADGPKYPRMPLPG